MKKEKNYFLHKDQSTSELVYIEYNKMDGYNIVPKAQKKDAIEVNKIVFVSPTLSEKLIRKKIEKKITSLINALKEIDEDEDTSGDIIKKSLVEAERLKLMLINTYVKYLGNTYHSLTLKKIQIIINQLRFKLYMLKEKEYTYDYNGLKGKGR